MARRQQSTIRKELERAFKPQAVPELVLELLQLEYRGGGFLSFGSSIRATPQQEGERTYSEDAAFLRRFVVFAQANWSGSVYAIWRRDESADPADCPVVIFGDEGGVHVVAQNLTEWARLLTYDTEPMVMWDSVIYVASDDDDARPSPRIADYRAWAQERFGLKPFKTDKQIADAIGKAQTKLQDELISFMRQYTDAFDGL